jgi:tetratricopeptide (TPR) repeat protein
LPEKDFSEIAKLSERYSKDPESRIFVQLADAYRKNSMIDEALDVLNNGLRYHPQYPLAYLIMGKCFFDKRMFLEAKESFEKTLSLDPQNIVALRMLAQTCELLQDREGQITAYRSILNLDPFDAAAKENFERLAEVQKKEPFYTISMAQEYERQNDLPQALEIYEHLLADNPADVSLQTRINELKETLAGGKPEAAPTPRAAEEDRAKKTEPREAAPAAAPPVAEEEKKPHRAEEVMSLEDFLAEGTAEKTVAEESIPLPPVVTPPVETTEPVPTAKEPVTREPSPPPPGPRIEEKAEATPPIEETAVPHVEKPEAEPPTAPPKPEGKKEESQKPGEEDFKSFQDWLSGLLK